MTPEEMVDATPADLKARLRAVLDQMPLATHEARLRGQLREVKQLERAIQCDFGPRSAAISFIRGQVVAAAGEALPLLRLRRHTEHQPI